MATYRFNETFKSLLRQDGWTLDRFYDQFLEKQFDGKFKGAWQASVRDRGIKADAFKELVNAVNDQKIELDEGQVLRIDLKIHATYLDGQHGGRNEERSTATLPRGESTAVVNIPYRRNPFFTGRQQHLRQLRRDLAREQAIVAISGLGGIGKTQLAVQFCFLDTSKFEHMFWCSSDTRESLFVGFEAIADQLKIPRDVANPIATVNSIKHWCASNSNWLLILDNADHPAVLDEFVPNCRGGSVLLTSRATIFDRLGTVTVLELDVFTESESFDFLEVRTNRKLQDSEHSEGPTPS